MLYIPQGWWYSALFFSDQENDTEVTIALEGDYLPTYAANIDRAYPSVLDRQDLIQLLNKLLVSSGVENERKVLLIEETVFGPQNIPGRKDILALSSQWGCLETTCSSILQVITHGDNPVRKHSIWIHFVTFLQQLLFLFLNKKDIHSNGQRGCHKMVYGREQRQLL